ncbi:peptidoglycan DD-metalloendopeptidase family protein [Haliangium sp.]|uniref:peptidoglycan DD-metalloendopeptidase family protein n=1 Tax=Haliangium sp. TaxID=2663208 RepID=UPI003D1116EE
MALGYAILHPARVELALDAEPRQAIFDDITDVIMSLVGGGNPGDVVTAFTEQARARLEAVAGAVAGLADAGGPFAAIREFLAAPPTGMPDLVGWLDRILAVLEALQPGALQATVQGWLDALFAALPILDSHAMFLGLRDLLSQALAAFEQPFLDGRRDSAAQRLVRAATVAHSYLDSMLENLEDALGSFSLRGMLDQIVIRALGGIQLTGIEGFTATLRQLRDTLGPLLSAMTNLSASLTVSVGASGALGEPGPNPTWRDDHLPTPHAAGTGLWWTDLITNVYSTFNLIWEMVRTAHWHRPGEVIISLLEVAWQLTRTLVRAIIPLKICEWESSFARWLFTDMAQFVIGLVLRFFASLHDAFAVPNYFLSAGLRLLRYYNYALAPRMFYLFARSWWYLQSWKDDDTKGDAPISIVRYCWGMWPVMWATSAFFGSFLPWEDYNIAEMSGLTVAMLIVGALVGWGLALLVVYLLGGQQPFGYPLERNWGLFALWAVATVWVVILAAMAMAGVNQLESSAPWVGGILGVVFAGLFIALAAVWGTDDDDNSSTAALVLAAFLIHITGIAAFGVLGVILWWYSVNEGRDQENFWDDLTAGTSPYLLPYPSGRTYFCGQANHGLFSHFQTSPGNRYSFDFNEDENEPVWAARSGVVVDIREVRTNGSGDANWITVQHLSWADGHDPGDSNERVLTYAAYFHLSQNRLWVREGQRVARGQHVADLDDTGISALHHLHFGVSTFQREWFNEDSHLDFGDQGNIPIVFGDPSVQGFRNYPILFSWPSGSGHHDGKPLAMSFYESSNQTSQPQPHPVAVTTGPASAGAAHTHELHIDPDLLSGSALPAGPVWVRTTWSDGHFHYLQLTQADLVRILKRQDLAGLTTTAVSAHTHGLVNDGHGITTFNTGFSQRFNVTPTVAAPPSGRIQARTPGLYHLLGEAMVLRVNGRATEYYLFGADRASVAGAVALDRAPAGDLDVGATGSTAAVPMPAGMLGLRQAVRGLNQAARTGGRDDAYRVAPVIVIESVRRGSGARVQISGGTAADALGLSAGAAADGSGVNADFDAMSDANLSDLLRDSINAGWTADPVGVTAGTTSSMTTLHAGGNALDFSASSPRVHAVLTQLYRHGTTTPAAPTPRIEATGGIPLSTGRLALSQGGPTWVIPILGTRPRVQLDPAHAALTGAGLTATPLRVRLRTGATAQEVRFRAGDSDAAAVARRITAEAEGVRAWVEGGQIQVEAVAAGAAIRLQIDKNAPSAPHLSESASGTAPDISTSAGGAAIQMDDATALTPDELRVLVRDADWRGGQGANPNPITAQVNGGRIELTRAGGTLDLIHDGTGLGFSSTAPDTLTSQPLAGVDAVPGGWLDVRVDGGAVYRAGLEAEPARLDGAAVVRLPRSGETLQVAVNGGAASTVTFGAGVTSAIDVATEIANQVAGVTARVAYRLVVDTVRAYGPDPSIEVGPSAGAAGAGFPHDLPATDLGWGHVADPIAVGAALNAPVAVHDGPVVPAFSVSVDGDRIKLTARSTEHTLAVRALYTAALVDPLGFSNTAPAAAHELVTVPLASPLDLGSHGAGYRVVVIDGTVDIAETIVELAAAPATAVTSLAPNLARIPADADGARLTLQVTPPGASADTITVDLRAAADLTDVADRINAASPQVLAWADQVGGRDRLHVQSPGGGLGWRLRLENQVVLAALGFDPADMTEAPGANPATDPPTRSLEVSGRGNVANGAAVTRDEVETIFTAAARHITQLDDPAAITRRSYLVEPSGVLGDLQLHAPAGTVSVVTHPPHLRARLNVTEGADLTTLAPGAATVALDNGVIRVSVDGRLAGAVDLSGWRATIVAPNPLPTVAADRDQQLNLLDALVVADAIRVSVDGNPAVDVFDFPPKPATIPAGMTGFEAVVSHFAEAVPGAWFGIVDVGGQKHFMVQSRTRGRNSQIDLDLRSLPAFGLLGWAATDSATSSASGDGNVDDLDQVAMATLQTMLEDARNRGAGPQSLVEARVDGNDLELAALSPAAQVTQTSTAADTPGNVALVQVASRQDVMRFTYGAAPRACQPGLATFRVREGGVDRHVRALIWGAPARLPDMSMPANPPDLNGRTLSIQVGTSAAHQVTFANIPATPAAQARVAAQIEAGCQWTVRAYWRNTTLVVETRQEGDVARISLLAVANDARTLLGIAAAGTVNGTNGDGSVDDLSAVTAAHYEAALDSDDTSFVTADPTADRSQRQGVQIDFTGCRPPDPNLGGTLPRYLRISSNRVGCMSSVIPMSLPSSLSFDRTLERGPAVRASVVLDAIVGDKTLPAGELMILLNENPPAPDLAPTTTVAVRFDAGDYSAEAVAARIHQELFQRGVGAAAAYPDGKVVIETLVNGIAGSIAVPAAGTTPGIASALCPGDMRRARGWPGAGTGAIPDGFRSEARAPTAATVWQFRTNRDPAVNAWAVSFTVPAGTIENCAQALHTALGGATHPTTAGTRRIGIAAVDPEGHLFIEAVGGNALWLVQVNGQDREGFQPLVVQDGRTSVPRPVQIGVEPSRVGQGFELPDEPGLGLRRTNHLRTVRYVRDGIGAGVIGDMDDLGWVRSPTDSRSGEVGQFPYWPAGRYLMAVRADAARIGNYDGTGDMIISHAAGADADHGYVHQARYWVTLSGDREDWTGGGAAPNFWSPAGLSLSAQPLGLRRLGDDQDDLVVEMIVWWS